MTNRASSSLACSRDRVQGTEEEEVEEGSMDGEKYGKERRLRLQYRGGNRRRTLVHRERYRGVVGREREGIPQGLEGRRRAPSRRRRGRRVWRTRSPGRVPREARGLRR